MQGQESQNCSVDGDEVALRLLPPCAWWVFKRDQLAAATKAAASGQEPTSKAGIDPHCLAASSSTFSAAGTPQGKVDASQAFAFCAKSDQLSEPKHVMVDVSGSCAVYGQIILNSSGISAVTT